MNEELPEAAVAAAEAIVDVLGRIGLDDDEIVDSTVETPDTVADPVDAVAYEGHVVRALGSRNASDGAETGTLQGVLAESSSGVVTDHSYHHKRTLEHALDGALRQFGYGFEFRSLEGDAWIEPEAVDHPRAFRLAVTDDRGETVSSVAFRYPPVDSTHYKMNNFLALGTALNDTVFEEIEVRMCLLATGGDSYRWFVFDRETLDALEAKYGPTLDVFGDPLVERGPLYDRGWQRWYDPSVATDHEAAFGVPEPDDTYKLEAVYDVRDE